MEDGGWWDQEASACRCAHGPVVAWTDPSHGNAQSSGLDDLVPGKAEA